MRRTVKILHIKERATKSGTSHTSHSAEATRRDGRRTVKINTTQMRCGGTKGHEVSQTYKSISQTTVNPHRLSTSMYVVPGKHEIRKLFP